MYARILTANMVRMKILKLKVEFSEATGLYQQYVTSMLKSNSELITGTTMFSYMFYGGSNGHVTVQDVVDASRNLKAQTSEDFRPQNEGRFHLEAAGNVSDIGINFNK